MFKNEIFSNITKYNLINESRIETAIESFLDLIKPMLLVCV